MIDLNQIVEHFLDEALWQCRNEGLNEDYSVVRSLNDRNESADAKRAEVLRWLRYYGALQGLNREDRDAVASVIVNFADSRAPTASPFSETVIVEKFNELHDRCRARVRRNKDQTPRNLTSLTSKALWCCYPNAIPIFDSYAQRALWVLSRLRGLARPPNTMEYGRFVAVWLTLYRGVECALDDARLGDYRYKVRVFDRILWIIGQPDYGDVRRQPRSSL